MPTGVLITGAGGQLASELLQRVPAGCSCEAFSRAELDIGDAAAVQRQLEATKPQWVINTAAYTAVDKAEAEVDIVHRANAQGPANLAASCAALGAKLIHISTDFVFDGSASQPYAVDAATAPLGVYGESKLAGEQAVQKELPGALVVRTAWVYSRFGNNFVKTMLRLMADRPALSVVADQVGTPTWAGGLAAMLWRAVAQGELRGVYHWTDAGVCSWYDFAVAIGEEAALLGLLENTIDIAPIPASDYPTPAQRPAYSVLDKSQSWRDLSLPPQHWRQQLRLMLQELKEQDYA